MLSIRQPSHLSEATHGAWHGTEHAAWHEANPPPCICPTRWHGMVCYTVLSQSFSTIQPLSRAGWEYQDHASGSPPSTLAPCTILRQVLFLHADLVVALLHNHMPCHEMPWNAVRCQETTDSIAVCHATRCDVMTCTPIMVQLLYASMFCTGFRRSSCV